jgi:hypothetical protein
MSPSPSPSLAQFPSLFPSLRTLIAYDAHLWEYRGDEKRSGRTGRDVCVLEKGNHRACGAHSSSVSGRPKRLASSCRSLHLPTVGSLVTDRSGAATTLSPAFQMVRACVSRSRCVSNGPSSSLLEFAARAAAKRAQSHTTTGLASRCIVVLRNMLGAQHCE